MKKNKLVRLGRRLKWLFGVYLWPRHESSIMTWNGLLSFDSKDRTLGRSLHVEREFERGIMLGSIEFLKKKKYLNDAESGIMLDVGGYIGMSSIGFMNAGIFSGAVAFEPNPNNYHFLKANIKNNNLENKIKAFNVALSNRNSIMKMELSNKNYGDHRVREDGNSEEDLFSESERKVIDVRTETLDTFLTEHPEVDRNNIKFIWMDIQGFESHFLSGAKSFFSDNKKIPVCMEFTPYMLKRAGVDKNKFCEVVSELFDYFYIFGESEENKHSTKELVETYEKYDSRTDGAHLILVN